MKSETFMINGENYSVRIGKNAVDNWEIIDSSNNHDLWFHLDNAPSCHLILSVNDNNTKIDRKVIRRCAYLCKINSKPSKFSNKTAVIYAPIQQIEKTDKIGQVYVKSSKSVYV